MGSSAIDCGGDAYILTIDRAEIQTWAFALDSDIPLEDIVRHAMLDAQATEDLWATGITHVVTTHGPEDTVTSEALEQQLQASAVPAHELGIGNARIWLLEGGYRRRDKESRLGQLTQQKRAGPVIGPTPVQCYVKGFRGETRVTM